MPKKNSANNYLTCPRLKGQPKKHIAVYHKCRFRKKCVPYRNHCQAELPFTFSSDDANSSKSAAPEAPEPETPALLPQKEATEELLKEIESELKALQKLCR